ncbi:BTB/POZ protein [Rhizophagus diaphanus]|nr:BTB/POZ protein [Rhizophagus diaphanus] [Rhizophagus sp. MUCL 43196]
MEIKLWPEFMKGYVQLFESKEGYDVIIQAGEEPNVQEIYAHFIILCCQSKYFRSNLKKKRNGMFILKISNIPPKILKNIFRFIYCGEIDLSVEAVDIVTLLTTANKFELKSLVVHIQEFLIDNHKEFIKNNVTKFLNDNTFENFVLIRNYCLEIIHVTSND